MSRAWFRGDLGAWTRDWGEEILRGYVETKAEAVSGRVDGTVWVVESFRLGGRSGRWV